MKFPQLVLKRPSPAGRPYVAEYFRYTPGKLPDIRVFADAPDGDLPISANGWLVQFRPIWGRDETWAVFQHEGKLFVDAQSEVYSLSDNEIAVRICPGLFFARASICRGGRSVTAFVKYPSHLLMFLDGREESSMEIDPFCYIFHELESVRGRQEWTAEWSRHPIAESE